MTDQRMMTNEFYRLVRKYPHVAFNFKSFKGGNNTPDKGFKHLVVLEPQMADPSAWDANVIKEYETYITWNPKFAKMLKQVVPFTKVIEVKGSVFCNHYVQLQNWPEYEDRISGVCIMNKLYQMHGEGEITLLREDATITLPNYGMITHVFSPTPWGGECYQGNIETPIHHSHKLQLNTMSWYKFMLCFESTYHELWSYGFMTERLFNAFKAKVVPIYFGCYNIGEYVPHTLYIDYRDFKDMDELAYFLTNFPKEKWIEMTEAAYEWEKTCDIGSMENLETILKGLQ